MKTCTRCHTDKPRSDFYAEAKKRDGLRSECKTCSASRRRAWRAENLEHERAYRRSWYAENAAKVNDQIRQRRFGLAPGQYEEMLEAQGGRCAICRSTETGAAHKTAFAVDHDHRTGQVRGLLCDPCNRGLGLLGDDPVRLVKAAAYLEALRVP